MSHSKIYKEYTLRLHKRIDLDLITLYHNDKKFKKKVVTLLSGFAKGEKVTYKLDGICIKNDGELEDERLTYPTEYMKITVNRKRYPEIIDMMEKIRFLHMGDFIKLIVRTSLPYPICHMYFKEFTEFNLTEGTNDKIEDKIENSEHKKKNTSVKRKNHPCDDEKQIKKVDFLNEVTIVQHEDIQEDINDADDDNYLDMLSGLVEDY